MGFSVKSMRPELVHEIRYYFWLRVEVRGLDDCWFLAGTQDIQKYQDFSYQRYSFRAHRLALELIGVLIPPKHVVCHHCDIPACVNPKHLFVGTYSDNTRDMDTKGRRGSNARGIAVEYTKPECTQ